MKMLETIKEQYNAGNGPFSTMESRAFDTVNRLGIPTVKHEEWKYTRISSLFNKDLVFGPAAAVRLGSADIDAVRLPGHEQANELVFINGIYHAALSTIRSSGLEVLPLRQAAENGHQAIVSEHLGHSGKYLHDGIHALNTAFVHGGVYLSVQKGRAIQHPVYIYQVTDARRAGIFSQPRSLVHIGENSRVQMVENYATIGNEESFINQVMEVVVEQDAVVEYYKIQNDSPGTSQVNTAHFRQTGRSVVHAVTITMNGAIIRNNLNMVMEAEHSESHMYGLYFLKGHTHVDNHTVVDNVKPHCQSNELYKGVIDEQSTAVFNGKIFVQPQAQKTNAFQSNKNILLSESATVNTKPQLEIFADDVKCSHGCTVGQLDDEAMFYLRSRGLGESAARSLLVHAFAIDVLEHIRPAGIREFIDGIISSRLDFSE